MLIFDVEKCSLPDVGSPIRETNEYQEKTNPGEEEEEGEEEEQSEARIRSPLRRKRKWNRSG